MGRPEDNPSEARLTMPPELAAAPLHDKYDFAGPGRGMTAAAGAHVGTQGGEEEADEEEEAAEEPASQRPVRRAARRGDGRKRQRYNEDSDASPSGEGESGGEVGAGMVRVELLSCCCY